MGRFAAIFVLLVSAALIPSMASAQGSIAGVVTDSSGAVLPGVTVEVASPALIERVRTGVTDGTLMKGVRFFGDGDRTSSMIMQNEPHQIRFIDSIHVATSKDGRIRF